MAVTVPAPVKRILKPILLSVLDFIHSFGRDAITRWNRKLGGTH